MPHPGATKGSYCSSKLRYFIFYVHPLLAGDINAVLARKKRKRDYTFLVLVQLL
jgi:hypothetical protein